MKLGKLLVEEGSVDQALATFQQSIKDNPREVPFYILSGELYEKKKDWDQAKIHVSGGAQHFAGSTFRFQQSRLRDSRTGGNVDVAMGLAQTARRGMPDSPNAADTLGWAYYQKGIYQSAISQFQEALRLSEKRGEADDADVHYHLGIAYEKTNQTALARQQLEKAVKLSPNNADARKALSDLRG